MAPASVASPVCKYPFALFSINELSETWRELPVPPVQIAPPPQGASLAENVEVAIVVVLFGLL